MANKTYLIAQREFLENVRTKTFWVSIFIVPLLIAAMIGGGALLTHLKEVQRYTVIDLGDQGLLQRAEREFRQGDLSALFQAATRNGAPDPALAELARTLGPAGPKAEPSGEQMLAVYEWMHKQPPEVLAKLGELETAKKFRHVPAHELGVTGNDPEQVRAVLNPRLQSGELFAYVILGKEPLRSLDGFEYVSNNLTDGSLRGTYEAALTRLIQNDRIRDKGIAKDVAQHIQQRVSLLKKQIDSATGATTDVKDENVADKWAPVGFVYFLFIAIMSITSLLLTNTIEEKSNRIIEVLLSSVSPGQLMHGKILGIAGTGLTIVLTWVLFGVLAAAIAPHFLGDTGGGLKVVFAALKNSKYLVAFVFYFLAGYMLYAAVLVSLGAACNSLKEAQNLMQPVMMMLFIPLIAMVFVTQEPNGAVARVLSFIPPFTPFTMMNRAGGPPELWEYVATSALLLVSIWLTFKAAGKIFRVGVLMTGKPPKLKEILGWLRQG
ncbi:MAG: ABC transporter permease [Planctomycetota bacterium]